MKQKRKSRARIPGEEIDYDSIFEASIDRYVEVERPRHLTVHQLRDAIEAQAKRQQLYFYSLIIMGDLFVEVRKSPLQSQFLDLVQTVLRVSKKELDQRIADDKIANQGRLKPGPKPRH